MPRMRQLGHSLDMFFRTYAEWIRGVKDAEQVAKLDGYASGNGAAGGVKDAVYRAVPMVTRRSSM